MFRVVDYFMFILIKEERLQSNNILTEKSSNKFEIKYQYAVSFYVFPENGSLNSNSITKGGARSCFWFKK